MELGPTLNVATLMESLSSVSFNDSSSNQKLIPNSVMTQLHELSYGCRQMVSMTARGQCLSRTMGFNQ